MILFLCSDFLFSFGCSRSPYRDAVFDTGRKVCVVLWQVVSDVSWSLLFGTEQLIDSWPVYLAEINLCFIQPEVHFLCFE